MKALILSHPEDGHVVRVCEHLARFGVHTDYLRYDQLSTSCQLNYRLSPGKQATAIVDRLGAVLDLQSYDSVWFRRPGNFVAPSFDEPWISRMVEQEMRAAYGGILHALPCRWVNHPMRDLECMQKLFQLDRANALGLAVPETIITNQPELVRQFYEDCRGQVVYKLIGENTSQLLPHYEGVGIPTLPLREKDLAFMEQVRYGPHLFQRSIEKAFDVRVTIVGTKIFAGRIHSQTGLGKLDWRHDYSVKMEPMELPVDVSAACLRLLRSLSLNYGALDFCETDSGEMIFLECNSAGQFLWLEERSGLPIALEMAKLLAHQTEALIPDARSISTVCSPPDIT